jgi:hypothetical protein
LTKWRTRRDFLKRVNEFIEDINWSCSYFEIWHVTVPVSFSPNLFKFVNFELHLTITKYVSVNAVQMGLKITFNILFKHILVVDLYFKHFWLQTFVSIMWHAYF